MSKMPKALARAAEVRQISDRILSVSSRLSSILMSDACRQNALLSHPTIALRISIHDGKPQPDISLFDRSRQKMDGTFTIAIDEAFGRPITAAEAALFLSSDAWEAVTKDKQLIKAMIREARAVAA